MKLLKFIPIKLTIMLVLGIWIGRNFNFGIEIPFVLSLVFLGLLGMALFWQKHINTIFFGFLGGLTTLFLGILVMALAQPKNDQDHYTHQNWEGDRLWQLKITEVLKPTSFSQRYLAEVLSTDSDPFSGKLLVNYHTDSLPKQFQVDEELVVFGALEAIGRPLNPHQFDYSNYLENQGVYHRIKLNSKNHRLLGLGSPTIQGMAANLRTTIITKLKEAHFGNDELGILQALLLGQRNAISEATYTNYKNAGAVHILAVSGLHIGILLLFLQFLLRPLELLPKGKTIKLVLIVLLLWGFAFLAGMSASVIRAVTMFSFVAYALFLNRPSNTFNILALSMFFILLVLDPTLLFKVGFQMSYLAVFAIVWIYPLLQKLWLPKNWMVRKIWQLLSVSIAAQVGVLPLSLYYFHQFPGLFFISNLLIIPFLGLILGLGIIVILMILLDIAPEVVVIAFNNVIGLMNAIIQWVAAQEAFIFKNISFDGIQMVLTYGLLVALLLALTKRTFKHMAILLISIICLQFWAIMAQSKTLDKEVLFIGHASKNSMVISQKGNQLHVFSTKDASSSSILTNYCIAERIEHLKYDALRSAYRFKNEKLLVIDSLGVYGKFEKQTEHVLLTQSPKINLERLIDSLQPKQLIADGSNYPSFVARWKRTAANKKIPFHYTGEKGAFYFRSEGN